MIDIVKERNTAKTQRKELEAVTEWIMWYILSILSALCTFPKRTALGRWGVKYKKKIELIGIVGISMIFLCIRWQSFFWANQNSASMNSAFWLKIWCVTWGNMATCCKSSMTPWQNIWIQGSDLFKKKSAATCSFTDNRQNIVVNHMLTLKLFLF